MNLNFPAPITAPPAMPDPRKVEILLDAFLKGELQFQRANTYRGQSAKLGHVFYWIHYEQVTGTDRKLVYSGAYEISTRTEKHLNGKQHLYAFLIFELAKQL